MSYIPMPMPIIMPTSYGGGNLSPFEQYFAISGAIMAFWLPFQMPTKCPLETPPIELLILACLIGLFFGWLLLPVFLLLALVIYLIDIIKEESLFTIKLNAIQWNEIEYYASRNISIDYKDLKNRRLKIGEKIRFKCNNEKYYAIIKDIIEIKNGLVIEFKMI